MTAADEKIGELEDRLNRVQREYWDLLDSRSTLFDLLDRILETADRHSVPDDAIRQAIANRKRGGILLPREKTYCQKFGIEI